MMSEIAVDSPPGMIKPLHLASSVGVRIGIAYTLWDVERVLIA